MLKNLFIVLLLLIVLGFIFIYWQNSQTPELGVNQGKLKPLDNRPNAVSTQTTQENKRVSTLAMKQNAETTKAALIYAIEQYGGAEIKQEDSDYIYVVFVTPTMKYRDDAEFWLDKKNQEVHFRSSSRAGYSDRGLNRQRYDALVNFYEGYTP